MSSSKGFFSFLDFNYVDGAIDLFEQSLRNSIDFNAMEDDVFEARVLTVPTKIVDNMANAGTIDATGDDLNVKYSFRARILGPLSPHKFLEDPCELSVFVDEGAKERAFSVIQDHTKVVLYGPQDNPAIGDVVRIKLERTGKTYNTKDAKQYLGIARSTTEPVKRTSGEDCATLAEIFDGVDFDSLSNAAIQSLPSIPTNEFFEKLKQSEHFAGWSDEFLWGLTANAIAESALKSNASGDPESLIGKRDYNPIKGKCSFGYWQLNICSRGAEGDKFIDKYGLDPQKNRAEPDKILNALFDEEKQFEYVAGRMKEIFPEYAPPLRISVTPFEAARLITIKFENPVDAEAKSKQRGNLATKISNQPKSNGDVS